MNSLEEHFAAQLKAAMGEIWEGEDYVIHPTAILVPSSSLAWFSSYRNRGNNYQRTSSLRGRKKRLYRNLRYKSWIRK